jgi:hypothetical protein
MKMREDCVECHNRPELGLKSTWKVGDFRGARQVTVPVPIVTPIIDAATYTTIAFMVLASWLGALIVLPVVRRLRLTLDQSDALATELDKKTPISRAPSCLKTGFFRASAMI